MPQVEVTIAPQSAKGAIANMMQLYIHDFSEQWVGRADGELEEDGRFGDYPYLAAYWCEAGRWPFLVRADGRLAGFALVNQISHRGAALDANMAEFFIARKHRRGGVGTAAARALFTRFPGHWEAAVARANTAALAFWRRAISGCACAEGLREFDASGPDWDGPILSFHMAPPA
jgi:predicted acetyltransferase